MDSAFRIKIMQAIQEAEAEGRQQEIHVRRLVTAVERHLREAEIDSGGALDFEPPGDTLDQLDDSEVPVSFVFGLRWWRTRPQRLLRVEIDADFGSVTWASGLLVFGSDLGVITEEWAWTEIETRDVRSFDVSELNEAILALIDHAQWSGVATRQKLGFTMPDRSKKPAP